MHVSGFVPSLAYPTTLPTGPEWGAGASPLIDWTPLPSEVTPPDYFSTPAPTEESQLGKLAMMAALFFAFS